MHIADLGSVRLHYRVDGDPDGAPVVRHLDTCEEACPGDDRRTAVWGDLTCFPRVRTRRAQ